MVRQINSILLTLSALPGAPAWGLAASHTTTGCTITPFLIT